jgi:cytochrome c-type protein NapB
MCRAGAKGPRKEGLSIPMSDPGKARPTLDSMPEERKRVLQMLAATAVALSLLGLIHGTEHPGERFFSVSAGGKGEGAVTYSELRNSRRGKNGKMYEGAFAALRAAGPGLNEPVAQNEEQKLKALERRAGRRAYAGAPPTIPHSVQERSPSACLACHGQGAQIAGLTAPAMSHKAYSMCTQCHAMQRNESGFVSALGALPPEHDFIGAAEPTHGDRAWEGAPPTIPHPVFMREKCSSCHGTHGALGMRSTHPARQNCRQCHAPASPFDQANPPPIEDF